MLYINLGSAQNHRVLLRLRALVCLSIMLLFYKLYFNITHVLDFVMRHMQKLGYSFINLQQGTHASSLRQCCMSVMPFVTLP